MREERPWCLCDSSLVASSVDGSGVGIDSVVLFCACGVCGCTKNSRSGRIKFGMLIEEEILERTGC